MTPEMINQVTTELLEACSLEAGKLTVADKTFLAFGERIRDSDDKKGWATAMIALAQRLRAIPGAGLAAERVTALAALALGDVELNALLKQELARK